MTSAGTSYDATVIMRGINAGNQYIRPQSNNYEMEHTFPDFDHLASSDSVPAAIGTPLTTEQHHVPDRDELCSYGLSGATQEAMDSLELSFEAAHRQSSAFTDETSCLFDNLHW